MEGRVYSQADAWIACAGAQRSMGWPGGGGGGEDVGEVLGLDVWREVGESEGALEGGELGGSRRGGSELQRVESHVPGCLSRRRTKTSRS